eukprot:m.1073460 g.1073460  ORF g.1073460 m.1073460 type:complete len:133 (-) comp24233_c0_seq8:328-726(-)
MVNLDPNIMDETEEVSPNSYAIRPTGAKFKTSVVQELIHKVLQLELADKTYDTDNALKWAQRVSEVVKMEIKDLGYERYKIVVNCVLSEQRGGGAKVAARCFWDSDTDNYAQAVFSNDTMFCVAAAYGVYYY